ncbi:hypothetical protein FIBSPDRAFT_735793 [Athelia psychrophila]|uniref:RING-type domain-containing protein n=1 Tax=Athelia psychrophila TaxID=1759441 RepID=A0A166MZ69_9AGAM|nr:hypothetical protein FIBSPDRAFT_735793 [Fibularhizoctonia sp. CBS 109695]
MSLCNICLGALKTPSALPCGHVFCYECILKAVKSVRPFTTEHRCPVCRERYTVEVLPRDMVPDTLQLHMTPSIRKLDITLSDPAPGAGLARHQAEILTLRAQRSELHRRMQEASATTAGLYMLAKAARDHGFKMQKERDTLAEECRLLKRRLSDDPYVVLALSIELIVTYFVCCCSCLAMRRRGAYDPSRASRTSLARVPRVPPSRCGLRSGNGSS